MLALALGGLGGAFMFCIEPVDIDFLMGISGTSFGLVRVLLVAPVENSAEVVNEEEEVEEVFGGSGGAAAAAAAVTVSDEDERGEDKGDDNDEDDDEEEPASFSRSGISMLSIWGRTRISAISVRTTLAIASVTLGILLETREEADASRIVSKAKSMTGSSWNPIHMVRDGGARHMTRNLPVNFFTYTTTVRAAVIDISPPLLLLTLLLLSPFPKMELPII